MSAHCADQTPSRKTPICSNDRQGNEWRLACHAPICQFLHVKLEEIHTVANFVPSVCDIWRFVGRNEVERVIVNCQTKYP